MSQRSGEPSAAEVSAAEVSVAEPSRGETSVAAAPPLLTVVRGEPTAAELAALAVVVDALVRRGRQRAEPERPAGSRWAAKDHSLRPQLRPGPGAWRASVLPR